jgi:hypothetical protein
MRSLKFNPQYTKKKKRKGKEGKRRDKSKERRREEKALAFSSKMGLILTLGLHHFLSL